jgi:uncharacterized membrane protein
MQTGPTPPEKSSTGLDVNLAAMLAYLFGPITGIAFLLREHESRFVRFHAMQSTLVFLGLFVFAVMLNTIPLLGQVLSALLVPLTVLLWVFLMFKAYQGEKYKLPFVGDIAEQRI